MGKIEKIERRIKQAEEFLGKNIIGTDPKFKAWNNSLIRFMEEEFGVNSSTTENFKKRKYTFSMYFADTPRSDFVSVFEKNLNITIEELKILLDEAKEDEEYEAYVEPLKIQHIDSKKVFIVHGRDVERKYELDSFLRDQGLEPIILHEQVNSGKTIIEKIEENSDVSCAIILLTPDDEGRLKDTDAKLKTRARQNVIFEAGYFMGKLGRNRTILISGVEETMSDIDGIVYLNINNYRADLLKELRALGLV